MDRNYACQHFPLCQVNATGPHGSLVSYRIKKTNWLIPSCPDTGTYFTVTALPLGNETTGVTLSNMQECAINQRIDKTPPTKCCHIYRAKRTQGFYPMRVEEAIKLSNEHLFLPINYIKDKRHAERRNDQKRKHRRQSLSSNDKFKDIQLRVWKNLNEQSTNLNNSCTKTIYSIGAFLRCRDQQQVYLISDISEENLDDDVDLCVFNWLYKMVQQRLGSNSTSENTKAKNPSDYIFD